MHTRVLEYIPAACMFCSSVYTVWMHMQTREYVYVNLSADRKLGYCDFLVLFLFFFFFFFTGLFTEVLSIVFTVRCAHGPFNSQCVALTCWPVEMNDSVGSCYTSRQTRAYRLSTCPPRHHTRRLHGPMRPRSDASAVVLARGEYAGWQ